MWLIDNKRNNSVSKEDADLLKSISGFSVKDLIEKKNANLLVFPDPSSECRDKTEDSPILKINWKDDDNPIVETYNFVGFIGIGDTNITIGSRFAENRGNDFFLQYMVLKALSVNILNISDLKHGAGKDKVLDFLLCLFPSQLAKALGQGIYRQYQRKELNDSHINGPIDFARHIKNNIPFNGKLAYSTRELSSDNNLTQLIRHTIEYIKTKKLGKYILNNSYSIKDNVNTIYSITSTYNQKKRPSIINANSKVKQHPYFTEYFPLQKLCLDILNHRELRYENNKQKINGILFDVSWLWEEYINSILKEFKFKHPCNKTGKGAIKLTEERYIRYPDFYKGDSGGIVLDAKYKSQIDPIADINQIITYLYRLEGKFGILVKPDSEKINLEVSNLLGYGKEIGAQLQIYSFNIPQNMSSWEDFTHEMQGNSNILKNHIKNCLNLII